MSDLRRDMTASQRTMTSEDYLIQRFLDFTRSRRERIASKLGLISPDDRELAEIVRCVAWFRRARERGLLDYLRDAIDLASQDDPGWPIDSI